MNLGIGAGIIILAALLKLSFYPVMKNNNRVQQINRLLNPEISEIQARMKKLREANERKLMMIESKKLQQIQEQYGARASKLNFLFALLQGTMMAVWASLCQRFSYSIEDYPEMINGGFLWFKDLSMSDPYFILPLINSFLVFMNIYVSSLINYI